MSDQDYPANNGQPDDEPIENEADEAGAAADEEPPLDPDWDPAVLRDRLLRLAAELENTRRRAEREKQDAGRYAIASFARDLIGVADNFERALQAAGVSGEDIPEGRSDAFKSLVAGIQMTEKELLAVLQRHGVQKLAPAGEKFDPNHHQAVAHVPSPTIAKGHVVDVAQPGFTIGDRVLRAAMVTVSSGAPATGPDGEAGDPGSSFDENA